MKWYLRKKYSSLNTNPENVIQAKKTHRVLNWEIYAKKKFFQAEMPHGKDEKFKHTNFLYW